MPPILKVPTNIITGFLGVGKTTAILHLLKTKPAQERWAVLVNEFGEIGIDGSLLANDPEQPDNLFIKEVPGGCMCCTAGLPMQVALNQLLKQAQPDRLLIEPTGLGHPKEVLQTLTSKPFDKVLWLQKTLTLIDARNLKNPHYTDHATFNQQLEVADKIIANKSDLYEDSDKQQLNAYIQRYNHAAAEKIEFTVNGAIKMDWLAGDSAHSQDHKQHTHSHSHAQDHNHSHDQTSPASLTNSALPASGYIRIDNQGEGFVSSGWRFANHFVFARTALRKYLSSLNVERLKAMFITNDGSFGYNLTADGLQETPLIPAAESRIELIANNRDSDWEADILKCVATNAAAGS